jgi:hypothetical protein
LTYSEGVTRATTEQEKSKPALGNDLPHCHSCRQYPARKVSFQRIPPLLNPIGNGSFWRNVLVPIDETNGNISPDPDLYGRSVERQHRVMGVNSTAVQRTSALDAECCPSGSSARTSK